MRRYLIISLALLEVIIAIAIIELTWKIPDSHQIEAGFGKALKITSHTEKQVEGLRDQIAKLRKQDFAGRAELLRKNTEIIAKTSQFQQIDFRSVEALTSTLLSVSEALMKWSETLDAERMKSISAGLKSTAEFIDQNVAQSSEKSADMIEEIAKSLQEDLLKLATVLEKTPPDLKAARAIYEGLATFDTGLLKLSEILKPEQIDAMKEGLLGMEKSLSTTAMQVEKIGGTTYPVVTLNGLKPVIDNKPLWPDGVTVAEGLKKASTGVKAAHKQLELSEKNIPDLRRAIDESRNSVQKSRESLGKALSQQGELESLMRALPKQIAAYALSVPKLTSSLTVSLRETRKLRDLATAIRGTQVSLDESLKRWPDLHDGLLKSAKVLELAGKQLGKSLAHRDDYQRAMESTSQTAKAFTELLPEFTEQLDSRLEQQETSLAQMNLGLSELNNSLPIATEQAVSLSRSVRRILFLIAIATALHAMYMLSGMKKIRPGT